MLSQSEKMMNNKTVCTSCGAEYDISLVRCPFCGAAYAPAEEEEYMDKLEDVRRDLQQQPKKGEKKIKKGISSVVCAIILAALVIMLLLFGMLWLSGRLERNRTDRQKEEFLLDQGITTQQEVTDQ